MVFYFWIKHWRNLELKEFYKYEITFFSVWACVRLHSYINSAAIYICTYGSCKQMWGVCAAVCVVKKLSLMLIGNQVEADVFHLSFSLMLFCKGSLTHCCGHLKFMITFKFNFKLKTIKLMLRNVQQMCSSEYINFAYLGTYLTLKKKKMKYKLFHLVTFWL